MHPEVVADSPGECPICHMALELRDERVERSGPSNDVMPGLTTSQAREVLSYVRFAHFGSVERRTVREDVDAPAWVDANGTVVALFYKDDLAALSPGEPLTFFAARAPNVGLEARGTGDPPVDWDRSTSQVRIRLESQATVLEPGEPGWITIGPKQRQKLMVPSSAVLESSEGPYVLTCSVATRKFTRRSIETGKVVSELTSVVGGLGEHDTIVTMNGFFLEAERRLRGEASGPEVMP